MGNFITNSKEKSLKNRLITLIEKSQELKFLVGFFYFSGIKELYETLKKLYENNQLTDNHIKVLVGLNVDEGSYGLYEIAKQLKNYSLDSIKKDFFDSIIKAFNSSYLDNKDVYQQAEFFIKLMQENKLVIKKTIRPNHAKLYLFKTNDSTKDLLPHLFITGSSNLTRAGLMDQDEFNVEIMDYGFEEAEKYFDNLWNSAVDLDKDDINKIVEIIKQKTFLKEVSPFEAYVFLLKTYIDLHKGKDLDRKIKELMEKKGYRPFSYQLEAASQAVANCEAHNGTILADVVGLGKTVIASMVAKALGKRGVVICPPHLIGDENGNYGWKKYINDFELFGWEVRSVGKLEETLQFVNNNKDIEVVIIDEAHRFRNENTQQYHYLKQICRGKTVILLTATPFNNRPSDIFSLLKLFTIPKKSTIVLDENLQSKFIEYESKFKKLSYIKNHHSSKDEKKRKRAKNFYKELFGTQVVDLEKVKEATKDLAKKIRSILEPVVIRRNRLDLKHYKEDIELPTVKDPIECFFELTKQQLDFYDYVIEAFSSFDEGGKFSGAIYFPVKYERGIKDISDEDIDPEKADLKEEDFNYLYQKNLYDFMRRLLVKRFESSFGAFYDSIKRFKDIYQTALSFIKKTNKFILDRQLMNKLAEKDPEEILQELEKYKEALEKEKIDKKYYTVYDIEKFRDKEKFIKDIQRDIELFEDILEKMQEIGLKDNDPKAEKLVKEIKEFLKEGRKIVIFTEYIDTAKHLQGILEKEFKDMVLSAFGNLSKSAITDIYKNFDAQYQNQEDRYKILLATDKLSEGFNLNRAGVVINYDIPWNPVRVIQRVGRINRIGKKVYDEIYIVNFFPTEKGADIVRSREIAQTKMYMIHNVLGEDAKIFDPDEEPKPSELYRRLKSYIEDAEESFYTKVKKELEAIEKQYPDVLQKIEDMPKRVKVAKKGEQAELMVFIIKGKDFFVGYKDYSKKYTTATTFEEVFEKIKTTPYEKSLPLSDQFWENYEKILEKEAYINKIPNLNDISEKVKNLLSYLIRMDDEKIKPLKPFIENLIKDIRSYGTLDKYILFEIVRSEKNIDALIKKISQLKDQMGENFIEELEKHLKTRNEEVIISIENQNV